MGRFARVVAVDVPHHVTQRGNARQLILNSDTDRVTYLALLQQYSELHGLGLLGYCLMSNHVHLIAVPHARNALAQALKHAHGRYATYWNAGSRPAGTCGRGDSIRVLDEAHLWEALRYVELNPVRARMVASAEEWKWSSALAHCEPERGDEMLEMEPWAKRWTLTEWRRFLTKGTSESEVSALRQCTHTGRPLGGEEFVTELEKKTLRPLAPQKGGRPKKLTRDARQMNVSFVA